MRKVVAVEGMEADVLHRVLYPQVHENGSRKKAILCITQKIKVQTFCACHIRQQEYHQVSTFCYMHILH